MARTTTDKNSRRLERGSSAHVEDPTIEQLAEEAAHTDDVAVRRTLLGWRELVSTLIPLVLIALVVYYATFPLRAWRWSLLIRTGGAVVDWRGLLRILFLGWFVNCIAP